MTTEQPGNAEDPETGETPSAGPGIKIGMGGHGTVTNPAPQPSTEQQEPQDPQDPPAAEKDHGP